MREASRIIAGSLWSTTAKPITRARGSTWAVCDTRKSFFVARVPWRNISSTGFTSPGTLGRISSPPLGLDQLRGGTKDATTQQHWIRETFKKIGHASTQTSHSGRKSGAQWAEIAGVSEEEVRIAGGLFFCYIPFGSRFNSL